MKPVAVRLAWGKLHLGGPTGRGYKAVCGRMVQCTEKQDDLVIYMGRDVGRAWRLETVCLDCDRRLQKALKRRRR